MQNKWTEESMDGALRAIPGFLGVVLAEYAAQRQVPERTLLWLNCHGVEASPHLIWRRKHTPSCKGIILVIRDLSLDPNDPAAVHPLPLILDRFWVMSGLTTTMCEALGNLHSQYAAADRIEAQELRKFKKALGI